MARIDLNVIDTFDGSQIARARSEVRGLAQEVASLPQGNNAPLALGGNGGAQVSQVATQMAAQVQQAGGVTSLTAQVQAQSQALTGLGQVAASSSAASVTVVNNIGNAANAQTRRLQELRREMEAIQHLQTGTGAGYRAANEVMGGDHMATLRAQQRGADPQYVAGLQQEAAQIQAQIDMKRIRPGEEIGAAQYRAEMEDQRRAGSAVTMRMRQDEQDRKFWEGRQKETQEAEVRARKESAESITLRNKFIDQDRKFWESNARDESKRIRPGEEMGAAQVRANLENERRMQQEVRAQESQASRAASADRRDMMDERRGNFDDIMLGSIVAGIGHELTEAVSKSLDAFGEFQLTRVGVEALEGGNTDNVISQARAQSKTTFGADYKDLLGYENQLVNQGTSREESIKLTQNLTDINAAMGGTSAILRRIMYNLSQVESQGKLTNLDNRQFQLARINLNPYIAKDLNIDKSQVKSAITDGLVTAEVVNRAIAAMGADPRFKDRGKVISETTLPGQQERAAEAWAQVTELAGRSVAPAMTKVLQASEGVAAFLTAHPSVAGAASWAGAGIGVPMTVLGGAAVARGTAGFIGNQVPALQRIPGVGNMLFGGGRGATPMNPLFVSPVGGGLAGGVPGFGGAATGVGGAATAVETAAGAATPWTALPTGMSMLGGGSVTMGGAALGAGLGAFGAYNNYQQSGDAGTAAIVGATEAMIAAFVPGGAIAVAITESLNLLVNETYNKPMEQAAENGEGTQLAEESAAKGPMSHAQKAADRLNRAQKLQESADAIDPGFGLGPWGRAKKKQEKDDLETEAESLRQEARSERKLDRQDQGKANTARLTADMQAKADAYWAGKGQGGTGDSGEIHNRDKPQAQAGPVVEGETHQTVTLLIPIHSRVNRVVSGVEQASQGA